MFPHAYRIKVKDIAKLEDTADAIYALNTIQEVRVPTEVAHTLLSIRRIVSTCGLVIVSILLVVSLIIIANTIKITVPAAISVPATTDKSFPQSALRSAASVLQEHCAGLSAALLPENADPAH